MNTLPRSAILFSLLAAAACTSAAGRYGESWSLTDPAHHAAFDYTDPAAFRCTADGLELFAAANYAPPHRSPLGVALLRGREFGDCEITVEAQQTGREYPHRDLVVVFGWRDAAHFAYAHLASAADASAHHVMLVDGADRRPATIYRSRGVAWGNGWHELRLVRSGTRVTVFFDGAETLVAEVPVWRGRIGLGSFDDSGRFRSLHVTAPR
jgi:hypothetical protein